MKPRSILKLFAASMLCVLSAAAVAEDVDLYSTTNSAAKPNVLIVIDNSSNWDAAFLDSSAPLPTCSETSATGRRKKFCSEVAALVTVINTLNSNIRVGLMMFNETGSNGAYVRFAVRDMNPTNKAALIGLINGLVMSGTGTDNSGSNQPYGKTMFEAFKYFGGYTDPAHALLDQPGTSSNPPANSFGPTAYVGTHSTGSIRRDYLDNDAAAQRSARYYGADVYTAFSSASSNQYISPITDACAKNFILFISNGNPGTGGDSSGSGSEQPAATLLSNINPTTTQLGSPETHASKGDEFAKYLNLTDVSPLTGQQNVITYTMGVYQPASASGSCQWGNNISTTDCSMITLMRSMAVNGGGTYYNASDARSLALGFQSFFADVQAVNSVFVSSSLPVSVNTQGTFLNQIYMGMFRPNADSKARWVGNMKEYQFTYSSLTGQLVLADNTSPSPVDAINPANGFIKPTATSFWSTPQTTDGTITPFDFWVNSPAGIGLTLAQQKQDAPDGDIVEKGGVAQRVRAANLTTTAQANRKVYSCPASGCTAATALATSSFAFNNTSITGASYQTAFGVSTATELSNIVNWVRGNDNAANEATPGPGTVGTTAITVRPSIHGDVLHSRPVLVNYANTGASTDNVIGFYGSNDGTLRAVQAGQGSGGGTELWSFVAPEFFGKLKRLRDTTPLLQLPSPSSGLSPAVLVDASGNSRPKDYFFDGAVTVYEERNSSGVITKEYLYVAARRGGNFIYALNVTDPNNPIFMWKKSTQSSGSNFSHMALTFSAPLVGKVKGNSNPVLIFGGGYYGGYDATTKAPIGEDAEPAASCSGATAIVDGSTPGGLTIGCGNRIFVLDAFTGNEIHSFPSGSESISKSVAADVSLVDSDGDNFVDRVYAVDVGGNVYRMDVNDANPSQWKLFKLALVTSPRKFMYPPEYVLTGRYTGVLVGSGDREKPLKTTGADRFYMFKDKKTGLDATGMVTIDGDSTTAYNMADAVSLNATNLATTLAATANFGWFYTFGAGEKVVNAPVVVGPVVYFSTSTPKLAVPGTCAPNLGVARAYGLLFTAGTAGRDINNDGLYNSNDVYVPLEGGGLPPSPVAGIVNVLDSATGQMVAVPFIIGSGGTTPPPPPPPCVGPGCPPPPCPGPRCIVCPTNTVPSSIGGSMVCLQPDPRRRKSYWFFKSDQ